MHDAFTPLGGMIPLINMELGEIIIGGVGAGLYGILILVVIAIFVAGLMVGRTPEYLGKKIEAKEVKMAMLAVLSLPLAMLGFTAVAVVLPAATASIANPGPHGFTEVLYAYTSGAANNGSAFAGLAGNTLWYNLTLGIAMLMGRFLVILPAMAIAGSLAAKKTVPASVGTFPTHGGLFVGLVVGVILIVGGLTFFPALALGPIVEHLAMIAGQTFATELNHDSQWRMPRLAPCCGAGAAHGRRTGGRRSSSRSDPGGTVRPPRLRSQGSSRRAALHQLINPEPTMAKATQTSLFDRHILVPAVGASLRKLDPRVMIKNPVMFVVEVVAALTTVLFIRDVVSGGPNLSFTFQIILWLWFTVLFANFAEAVAEGRGKAQAEALRRTRTGTQAKLLVGNGRTDYKIVPGTRLKVGDVVLVEAGDIIPSDGEVIEGVASVNEAAITGESAPVIREFGWRSLRGHRRHAGAVGLDQGSRSRRRRARPSSTG